MDEEEPLREQRVVTRYTVNSGAPDFESTNHVFEKVRYVTEWEIVRDTERGIDHVTLDS